MSRRGVEQETSSAGCLVTGIASVVLPVVLFLLLAWPFGLYGFEVKTEVLLATGCIVALVFAAILGFLGQSPLDGAIKVACMSPGLLLADFGGPWLGVAGVALFSGALAVFILSCLPKG